ncbi:MAG: chorismate-binding protein, partial [Proteobacteria bacterium]|nr:chorismate-binding protein [Pseudomonadota bacterium]
MAPTVRSFSAGFDPLRLIAQFPDCYPGILESGSRLGLLGEAGGNDDARFDILPFANGEFLSLPTAGGLKGRSTQGGFLDALNRWCRELRSGGGPAGGTQAPGLPFRGGWMVYLGYEIAAEVEPCLMLPPSTDRLTALALRTPAAWIRDRRTGNGWLVAESGHEGLLERFQAHCRQIGDAPPADRPKPGLQIREEEPEAFLGRVERALEYIAAGEIYQANLSRGWSTQSAQVLDPVVVYQRLRRANPGPFCALLRFGDFAVASSSPERLVMSDGRRVRTRPIAGTRPRGSTTQSDAALIRELTGSEKERAEHIMLIDLERNDLGRVCEGGSVEVDEFMVVESYAHVHHIVSSVVGNLRSGVGIVDILKAV